MRKSINGYLIELKERAKEAERELAKYEELKARHNRVLGLITEELGNYSFGKMTDEELRKFKWLRGIKELLNPDK